ncbi:MAG: hypothetical protein LBH37_03290 [Oscillospiraceae bacterium]|nr:hypothetical protein [Oscillospiraceae bacterium]
MQMQHRSQELLVLVPLPGTRARGGSAGGTPSPSSNARLSNNKQPTGSALDLLQKK